MTSTRASWVMLADAVMGCLRKTEPRDFPGGPVVKNLPSNAGDTGSASGRGTKIPHAAGQLSLCAQLLSPHTLEPTCHS